MPRWNGGVIGAANNPTTSSAKGIWSLSEATKAIRAGLWPPSNAGADPYFENVTMLLSGDGTNGAQNNTFLDSSTNNFTITRNGNTTQGTFTPFSKVDGRWGNYFDGGGGSYLTTSTTSTALAMGSGQFTIEAWIFTADTSFMIACSTTSAGCGFGYNIDNGTQGLWLGRAGTGVDATSGVQLAYNTWNHVAVTRDGSNVVKFWVNGTQSGSNTTVTSNYGTSAQAVRIAADGITASTFGLAGYVSNLRITKGAALYTSTFTPSTAPFSTTVSSGTVSLLACQSNRFIDNSVNAFTLTVAGSGTAVQTFSPFPTLTAYASGTNGGSGYFDVTGDTLSAGSNAAFALGTGDFTVETFAYYVAQSNIDAIAVANWDGVTWGSNKWSLHLDHTTARAKVTFWFHNYSSTVPLLTSTNTLTIGQWHHVAVSRNGNTFRLFINGVLDVSATNSTSLDGGNNSPIYVGGGGGGAGSQYFNGYLSSTRLVKGTAVYTATFTIPTAPLTAVSGTSILLNYTNGGIVDAAMSNDLETVGGAQISTTQSKFGGSSIYVDGSGDRLLGGPSPNLNLSSGNWTIEAWVYLNSVTGYQYILNLANSTGTTSGLVFGFDGNKVYMGNGAVLGTTGTTTLSTGQFYHITAVKNGSNVQFYVNGTADGSAFSFTPNASQYIYIGSDGAAGNQLNAYIDDLRITRGIARYTANFTAPTAPFNGFGD